MKNSAKPGPEKKYKNKPKSRLATDYLEKIDPLPFRFQDLQKRFGSYEHLLAEIERRFPNLKSLTKSNPEKSFPCFASSTKNQK